MQASGGLPPGFPGSVGGAAGLPGLPPGLPVSSASLLAGMPPSSSAALVQMMAGARLPGPLPHPADLYSAAADKEKELAKLNAALPGPMSGHSDDRNVSYTAVMSSMVNICIVTENLLVTWVTRQRKESI